MHHLRRLAPTPLRRRPPPIPSAIRRLSAPSLLQSPPPPPPQIAGGGDPLDEFLSRFVHALKPHLDPQIPKPTLDSILLTITQQLASKIDPENFEPPQQSPEQVELSDELWKIVHDVSHSVHVAMSRDRARNEIKKYLHSDEVKEMCHFAADAGIRGNMLRELRFKWAREKMADVQFYEQLDRVKNSAEPADEMALLEGNYEGIGKSEGELSGTKKLLGLPEGIKKSEGELSGTKKLFKLPERKGRIKYGIYGLDLSDPAWEAVARKVEEAERHYVEEELLVVEGRSKVVEEKLVLLDAKRDDVAKLVGEWAEELKPRRVDWMALLDRIKARSVDLYFKVAEHLLTEDSFEVNVRDYSKLIEAHSEADRFEEAERILDKMTERGIAPDVVTNVVLVQMYSNAGNLELANAALQRLKKEGFQINMNLYRSMITAYLKAGLPQEADALIREMDRNLIKPTKEMYMDLLRAFAERGDTKEALNISKSMLFAGIQPSLESYKLLVEAFAKAGEHDKARNQFDNMMRSGYKPDDRCTASMVAAYVKNNQLDTALELLLTLQKDGFQPGVFTNSVLVDWMCRLQLVDEAERLVSKIIEKEELPFETHVSLCEMYSKVGQEEKARKSLKILEGRKHLLQAEQFERIIQGLLAGGFVADAKRILDQMQKQGFSPNQTIKMAVGAAESVNRLKPSNQKSPQKKFGKTR